MPSTPEEFLTLMYQAWTKLGWVRLRAVWGQDPNKVLAAEQAWGKWNWRAIDRITIEFMSPDDQTLAPEETLPEPPAGFEYHSRLYLSREGGQLRFLLADRYRDWCNGQESICWDPNKPGQVRREQVDIEPSQALINFYPINEALDPRRLLPWFHLSSIQQEEYSARAELAGLSRSLPGGLELIPADSSLEGRKVFRAWARGRSPWAGSLPMPTLLVAGAERYQMVVDRETGVILKALSLWKGEIIAFFALSEGVFARPGLAPDAQRLLAL